MTRLEACIKALEALKIKDANTIENICNKCVDNSIAEITRILSAEPSEEEIQKSASAIRQVQFLPDRNHEYLTESRQLAKAALMTMFCGRER